jgi:hypothetical protein
LVTYVVEVVVLPDGTDALLRIHRPPQPSRTSPSATWDPPVRHMSGTHPHFPTPTPTHT